MRITGIQSSVEDFQLARPYTIAFRSVGDVQMSFVRLNSDVGLTGIGCASPESMVTGEPRWRFPAANCAGSRLPAPWRHGPTSC